MNIFIKAKHHNHKLISLLPHELIYMINDYLPKIYKPLNASSIKQLPINQYKNNIYKPSFGRISIWYSNQFINIINELGINLDPDVYFNITIDGIKYYIAQIHLKQSLFGGNRLSFIRLAKKAIYF